MVEAIAAGVPIEPLARYFEYWLLRLQGVYEAGSADVGRGAGVPRDARASSSPFALGDVTVSPRALRELEDGASRADRDAPGEGPEVGAGVARRCGV